MQIKTRGATPIEKNVIVVDEQGNEYEATYPKRAKGLVKNGRARFVSENKICLACPPNENLEDNKMSDNIINEAMNQEKTETESVPATKLPWIPLPVDSTKEKTTDAPEVAESKEFGMTDVWNQIVKLQEELVDLKSVLWNHQIINDSDTVGEDGEPSQTLDTNVARMKITSLNSIFEQREKTLNSLLDFYKSMYNDFYQESKKKAEMNDQAEKIGLIKSAFDQNMAFITEGGLDADDQCAALTYVTDKIAELVKTVIVRSADESEEQKNKRREFLDFVSTTTVTANGAATEGAFTSLPDFDNIWKTVFLGS